MQIRKGGITMINGIGFDFGSSFSGSGFGSTIGIEDESLGVGFGVEGARASNGVQEEDKVNPKGECQTCKNRKYQDGSDEMVSFKSATHISPQAAGAAVRGHEGEHVSNAYKKAFQEGGKVVSVGVSIHTAVCPECGRTYVSGGTTHSVISTPVNEDKANPYTKNKNAISKANSPGLVMDFGV